MNPATDIRARKAHELREDFRTQALWIQERPRSSDAGGYEGTNPTEAGQDMELAGILDAIAQDVARLSAGASAAAAAEYAAAVTGARKQFPKHLVGGIIRSLKDALQAKLAEIKKVAKADLAGRREAAISARRGRRLAVRPRPPDGPNHK